MRLQLYVNKRQVRVLVSFMSRRNREGMGSKTIDGYKTSFVDDGSAELVCRQL